MKNKKKNGSVSAMAADEAVAPADEEPQRPAGILKSTLKRSGSKKGARKKNRVQFDEGLNKFFEADYVILVRDEVYDDEDVDFDELEDGEYGRCECGNRFCYDSCYYEEDFEPDEGADYGGEYRQYGPPPASVRSPFDFVAAFDPPMDFVDPVTLSPPDGYKDAGCVLEAAAAAAALHKVSATATTSGESKARNTPKEGAYSENRDKQQNENKVKFNEKTKTQQQQGQQQQQHQQQKYQHQEHIYDSYGARKDQSGQGYGYPRLNEADASNQVALFNNSTAAPQNNGYPEAGLGGGSTSSSSQSQYIVETITMTTVTERRIIRESSDQIVSPPAADAGGQYAAGSAVGAAPQADAKAEPAGTAGSANDSAAFNAKFSLPADRLSAEGCCDKSIEGFERGDFTLTFKLGNRVVPCNSLKPNSAVRQLFPDPRFANQLDSNVEGGGGGGGGGGAGGGGDDNLGKCEGKYLVTEESLRAFNEVNRRSVFAMFGGKERYPYCKEANLAVQSDDEDVPVPENDLIKKTIERNTLRRSLLRYPRAGAAGPGRQRARKQAAELTLEERIKQLTCDIDDEPQLANGPADRNGRPTCDADCGALPPRISPTGEESRRSDQPAADSAPPSAASAGPGAGAATATAAARVSAASTTKPEKSSAYKKFAHLFRNHHKTDSQQPTPQPPQPPVFRQYQDAYPAASQQPDLGIDMKLQTATGTLIMPKKNTAAIGATEKHKQFLSSLAPLTACVTGHVEPNYGNREKLKLRLPGDRMSIIGAAGTSAVYSIADIDEAGGKPLDKKGAQPQPDVVAGTPSADTKPEESATLVQMDVSSIKRLKKRLHGSAASAPVNDDEHDDYGFSRRPTVRSIKSHFGSTTEILQQMQNHLQPPLLACPTRAGSHMTWPYYVAQCDGATEPNAGATSPSSGQLPILKDEYVAGQHPARLQQQQQQQPPLRVDASAACGGNVHLFRLTPANTLAEVAVPYKSDGCVDLRRFSVGECGAGAGNIFQMKVSPVSHAAVGGTASAVAATQLRLPINVADGGQFAAAHPIQVGTTSVIRVGHGQQQTFRVPCPVGGPVQVHLLATHHHHYETPASSAPPPPVRNASSQPVLHPDHQHLRFASAVATRCVPMPVPIPVVPPQQIVLAKGTQTSTISSTTSYYQLQTNAQVGATNYPSTAVAAGNAAVASAAVTAPAAVSKAEQPAKLVLLNYPTAHTPIAALTSSPTRIKSHNQLTERGVPEGAVSASSNYVQDIVKPESQVAAAELPP